ncbi:hypothetical protein ElyMa_005178600 [Elysia marginata]|uniref:Syndecan/Neurexin domain-containing protein n=1 Tax=Elysia marginata TaxID=1093978 RepID=A0AAV4JS77_9GAST|nr:hypothetical protein ElyMa_005178600 [Elysia marginata]
MKGSLIIKKATQQLYVCGESKNDEHIFFTVIKSILGSIVVAAIVIGALLFGGLFYSAARNKDNEGSNQKSPKKQKSGSVMFDVDQASGVTSAASESAGTEVSDFSSSSLSSFVSQTPTERNQKL